MSKPKVIEIDGVKYTRQKKTPSGNRVVLVVSSGWVFAGDLTESEGRIKLTNALWLFRWESIGFSGVISDPKNSKVDLRAIDDVDVPVGSEIFRVPVADDWGL